MQHWFITGISRGIGAALAAKVLADGGTVVGTVREAAAAEAFAALAPGRARAIVLDLFDSDAVEPAVATALDTMERVDVVVNNAGMNLFGAVEEAALDEVRMLVALNLLAPFAVMKAALPRMRVQGSGRIVNISSGAGLNGMPGGGIYSASKFALEGLSEAAAKEVAGQGIGVLLVEPGAVDTGFIASTTHETALRLEAYAALTGWGKADLLRYYETNTMSAASVADAIRDALAMATMPLRLVIGDDVKRSVARRAEEYRSLAGA